MAEGLLAVVLLMVLATGYAVAQLTILASPTRSIRAGTLVLAILTGCYICGLLAVLAEVGWTRLVRAITGSPLTDVVAAASFTVDPIIEEVVKLLPLVLLVICGRRIRAQWGLTDYLLVGGAIGAGFTLIEAVLRFGDRAGRAIPDGEGNFLVPLGLNPQRVNGLVDLIPSWLPAPVEGVGLFAVQTTVNYHLVWSALAAFGLGVVVRGRSWQRLLGLLPLGYASLDHAALNFDVVHPALGGLPRISLDAMEFLRSALPGLVLVVLGIAVAIDLVTLRRTRAIHPEVRLSAEGERAPVLALTSFAALHLPWTALVASRFVLARRAALFALSRGTDSADQLPGTVAEIARQIDAAQNRRQWRGAWQRLGGRFDARTLWNWRTLVWLVLLAPAVLYLVVGGVPLTAAIQRLLIGGGAFALVAALSLAALVFGGWQIARTARTVPPATRSPWVDVGVAAVLRVSVGAAALGAGVLLLGRWVTGVGGDNTVIVNYHVLEALGEALLILALMLAVAAFVWFPPFALVGVAGGGAVLVLTPAAAATAATLAAATILGSAGMVLSEASQPSGSSGGPGGGGGSRGHLDPDTRAQVQQKLPDGWGSGAPNKKGVGTRWQDPANPGNGVRVDRGDPDASLPSQRVDHVVVRRNGRILDRNGDEITQTQPSRTSEAHIPLREWLRWRNWWGP
jgi:hypothetical protein